MEKKIKPLSRRAFLGSAAMGLATPAIAQVGSTEFEEEVAPEWAPTGPVRTGEGVVWDWPKKRLVIDRPGEHMRLVAPQQVRPA